MIQHTQQYLCPLTLSHHSSWGGFFVKRRVEYILKALFIKPRGKFHCNQILWQFFPLQMDIRKVDSVALENPFNDPGKNQMISDVLQERWAGDWRLAEWLDPSFHFSLCQRHPKKDLLLIFGIFCSRAGWSWEKPKCRFFFSVVDHSFFFVYVNSRQKFSILKLYAVPQLLGPYGQSQQKENILKRDILLHIYH